MASTRADAVERMRRDRASAELARASGYTILGVVEAAAALEIEGLGAHPRPGFAAAALALARVLVTPKQTLRVPIP